MTERSDLAELAKRRGFFFPSSEAYGGTAGLYTYGPEGAALKRNLEDAWRDQFVRELGHMELEAPGVLEVALQRRPLRAVCVEAGRPAVGLVRGEEEAAPSCEFR